MVATADKEETVIRVVRQHHATINTDSLIPASPVILGTLMNKRTPKIFYITGKNTPNTVPYFLTPF